MGVNLLDLESGNTKSIALNELKGKKSKSSSIFGGLTRIHKALAEIDQSFNILLKDKSQDYVDYKYIVADAFGVGCDELKLDGGFADVDNEEVRVDPVDILALLDALSYSMDRIRDVQKVSLNFTNAYLYMSCVICARLISYRENINLSELSLEGLFKHLSAKKVIWIEYTDYVYEDPALVETLRSFLLNGVKGEPSDYEDIHAMFQLHIRTRVPKKI